MDRGLGAAADAFKEAADRLTNGPEAEGTLNDHLPAGFLYRHAIELYLKSGILIVHSLLGLQFAPNAPDVPAVPSPSARWTRIERVHSIEVLYDRWRDLTDNYGPGLSAPVKTRWERPDDLDDVVERIENLDPSGEYFRYPYSKHATDSPDRSLHRPDQFSDIVARMAPGGPYVKAFALTNESGEVVRSYRYDDEEVTGILGDLDRVANYLADAHALMRLGWLGGSK